MPGRGALARIALFALVALMTLAWLGSLSARHLDKTDEGRYAEIPREMLASGDWLTPHLDGLKYFEKPPLQYWGSAAAYRAFGVSEWSSRLWCGLCSLLGVFVIGFTGSRLFGARAGAFAAAVLASSLLYLLMGHLDTLDMGLTFFMEAGLCAALLARADDQPGRARNWMLGAWIAFALAVLSKGLIGIVLPGAVLTLYLALTRDWVFLRRILTWRGMLAFLVIGAPWFIAVSVVNPDFARFFFIHEHFERFLTNSAHRAGPWWYFIPVIALGAVPWLSWLPAALWNGARRDAPASIPAASPEARFAPALLLVLWSAFIFVFFSVSSSKLPSYVLPIFPALALLIGRHLDGASPRSLRVHAAIVALAALGLAAVAWNASRLAPPRTPPDGLEVAAYAAFGRWLLAASLVWLGGALALAGLARRATRAALFAFALAGIGAGLIALCGYSALDRYASSYYVAQALRGTIDENGALYSVEMYDQSLPFYLGRTMTLVNQRDELDFGLNQEPAKGVPTLDAFAQRWRADASATAVMPPTTYRKLVAMNLPMRVILADRRFVVVSKP